MAEISCSNAPLDAEGRPTPWYTYAATIQWLNVRIPRVESVFEFGAGNSTLWFSRESARRSQQWSMIPTGRLCFSSALPANATVVVRSGQSYIDAVDELGRDRKFDIIVIDGIHRVSCAQHARTYTNRQKF